MTLPINGIRPPSGIQPIESSPRPTGGSGAFKSFLSDAIGKIQQTQEVANTTADKFLSGENEEVHQVAIETQKAELQFEMFMAVRNKVVQAYQEVMRMQM